MKKIPSLFIRDWQGDRNLVTREVNPECQWVVNGEGVPTRKWDGTAVLVEDRALYKRYDAKQGKTPPVGFKPAQPEPDPESGHWPGWLPVASPDPSSKWHWAAWKNAVCLPDGTYELCGPHFQTNPEGFEADRFIRHGIDVLNLTFDPAFALDPYPVIADYLEHHAIEGIVWHHPDGRMCKIKRRDFGLRWPA